MSREAPSLPPSVDAAGISVLTTTRSFAQPNYGMAWRSDVLAAGVPVHFHRLFDGRWLMLLTRRWTAATVEVEPVGPQDYSAWTEDLNPAWVPLQTQGNFGTSSPAVELIPSRQSGTRVLIGAVSRTDFLFTLSTLTDGDQTGALIQDFHTKKFGTINLVGEEVIPTVSWDGNDIVFDRGCTVLDSHLVVVGADADRRLYLARKPWSRISAPGVPWEYWSDRGWDTSVGFSPLTGPAGVITSHGPVSLARYRNRFLLSVVTLSGDDYSGQMYIADDLLRWVPLGEPVALGAEGYLGGGLFLQPQLGSVATESPQVAATFPYVSSVKVTGSGQSRIDTRWGQGSILRRT